MRIIKGTKMKLKLNLTQDQASISIYQSVGPSKITSSSWHYRSNYSSGVLSRHLYAYRESIKNISWMYKVTFSKRLSCENERRF